jgi:electron transport complex protein RnfB
MNDKELVNQIIEVLPQLQCKKCEYPDCKSYAQSIINKKEKIDKCEPGGPQTQNHIKALLLNHNYQPNEQTKMHEIADIVREECIGCTICIKVCPVDAIVGARHMIHKVLEDQCNGCELCIDECPVNCMSMIKADQKNWVWPSKQSEDSKNNYYQRLDRLDRIKKDKEENRKKVLEDSEMQEYIKYALETESKKNKNIKKYE